MSSRLIRKCLKYRNTIRESTSHVDSRYNELIKHWILRLLVLGKLNSKFVMGSGEFYENDILNFIGLGALEGSKLSPNKTRSRIAKHWRKQEKKENLKFVEGNLEKNLKQLQAVLNLSDLECSVFHFILLLRCTYVLEQTVAMAGDINSNQAAQLIAIAISYSPAQVRKTICRRSALHGSGLISVDKQSFPLAQKFDLQEGLEDQIFSPQETVLDLMDHLIKPAKIISLSHRDFEHLDSKWQRMRHYLGRVQQCRTRGG